jgi:hypothetical protein
MSTANKERMQGSAKELYRAANDLGEPIELEFEIHLPPYKPLLPRRRNVRIREK